MKNRIKNIVKQVFLTEDENKRLLALMANEKESNFSAFARKKLFNKRLNHGRLIFQSMSN
jgi:hypothetical protein